MNLTTNSTFVLNSCGSDGSSTSPVLWIVGVLLCIGSSTISNLGLTFQKLVHLRSRKNAIKSIIRVRVFALISVEIVMGTACSVLYASHR